MPDETCGDCRFWDRKDEADHELARGFCRRNPPTLCPEAQKHGQVKPLDEPIGYWPVTFQCD